jgi:hypothetical protein
MVKNNTIETNMKEKKCEKYLIKNCKQSPGKNALTKQTVNRKIKLV